MYQYEKKETILKVEGVSLKLGENQILKDINIEIKDIVRPGMTQGQIISLIGKSGAGKTKLFEIISGIIQPTTGSVLVGEKLEPVKIGRVGVVQQNYPLFEHRTVFGNLEIAAKIKYKDKKERVDKINDILSKFNLIDKKECYPIQMSGGQRQRISIAQQVLCSNNLLLFDEPTSGLDPFMKKNVKNLILEIGNMCELNTIFIVTHDIESAVLMSDTIFVMGHDYDLNGKIIPGAKIKYEYDLISRGIAWRQNIESLPEFHVLCDELKKLFEII